MLEAAAEIAESVEEELREEERKTNGIHAKDFAGSDLGPSSRPHSTVVEHVNGNTSAHGNGDAHPSPPLSPLIPPAENSLPKAVLLMKPPPDHPPPSQRELFEHALQLRMTELVLAELLAGPDGAELHWPSVFAWFADRRDTSAQGRE